MQTLVAFYASGHDIGAVPMRKVFLSGLFNVRGPFHWSDKLYFIVLLCIDPKYDLYHSYRYRVSCVHLFTYKHYYYYYYGNRTQGTVVKTHTQKYNQIERKK